MYRRVRAGPIGRRARRRAPIAPPASPRRTIAAKTRTFPTHVDIAEAVRTAVIELLNTQFAATCDLYRQTKQAHWNAKGKDFFRLHELFDTLAETTLAHVDLIAERMTALGGSALGTARMAAATSALPEYPVAATDGPEHVAALVERYGNDAASTRAAIDRSNDCRDADTADLFT